MGKCFSCCTKREASDRSTSAGGQTLVGGHSTVLVEHQADMKSTLPETYTNGTSKMQSSGDRQRLFPCPRIPPLHHRGDSRKSLSKEISEAKIQALFDVYKDPDEDVILSEGVEKLCHDLDVQPEEFKMLVLAWKFNCETMCKFTRSEFLTGCKQLHVDNLRGIRDSFPEILQEVRDHEKFKDLYRWTFKFGLDADIGQRILPTDIATSLWRLVFSQKEPPILKRWLSFLEKHPHIRGIPKDTWFMFLNFTESVGNDLSSYDDTEAWPSLFDDFVEYENDQTNQNTMTAQEPCHVDDV